MENNFHEVYEVEDEVPNYAAYMVVAPAYGIRI